MKQKLLQLICLAFALTAGAQAPTIQWQKALGGTSEDQGNAIIQTADGGFITAGITSSSDGNVTGYHGMDDFWVVKLTTTGTISWQKTYGGTGFDIATGIAQAADGGYVICGYTESTDGDVTGTHANFDFWVVKINSTGVLQWQKIYGGFAPDLAESIAATTDGGFILAGSTASFDGDITENQGNGDAWLVKINSAGTIQWQKTYGGTEDDRAASVAQTVDGGYIFAGKSDSNDIMVSGNHGEYDYWVVKVNSTGAVQWQKSLGGTLTDEAKSVIQTSDGGYIVNGIIESSNGDITGFHGEYDAWVVKLNASGALQWQRALGGGNPDRGYDIVEAVDGGFIALSCPQSLNGDLTLASDFMGSYWLAKLNSSGVLQWQKSYGGSSYDQPNAIVKTGTNEFAITGYTYSNDGDVSGNHGDYDYWVLKLGGELELENLTPAAIRLYPNPVYDLLQFENITDPIVSVKVTDITGKIVLQQALPGQSLNVENLAQGTYILNIYTESNMYRAKFIKQ